MGQGLRPGAVPAQYAALVQQAGSICPAAPPSIIAAQIEAESGWDPNSVSSAGAQGISQFMPGTWPGWSLPGQSPFDPAAAIPARPRAGTGLEQQWNDQWRLGVENRLVSGSPLVRGLGQDGFGGGDPEVEPG